MKHRARWAWHACFRRLWSRDHQSSTTTAAVHVRAGKNNKLNFFVVQDGPFGTPILTPKIPPKKFMLVLFLLGKVSMGALKWGLKANFRSFPGIEAHTLFPGAPECGLWVGDKKFMLREYMCLFCQKRTHRVLTELTEFATERSECSWNSIPPVSQQLSSHLIASCDSNREAQITSDLR